MNIDYAVLICTHNGEDYVYEQIRSVCEQTLLPNAIYIFDWNSSDKTLDVIDRCVEDFGGVCINITSHAFAPGSSMSFMYAIKSLLEEKIKFDYLLLCDQDDIWESNKIREINTVIASSGEHIDLVFSDLEIIDSDKGCISSSYYKKGSPFNIKMTGLNPFSFLDVIFVNPVAGMSMAVSKDMLSGFSDYIDSSWIMHDWAILIYAVSNNRNVFFIDRSLVKYRQHSANVLGASRGFKIVHRIRKAKAHFSKVRLQLNMLLNVKSEDTSLADKIRGVIVSRISAVVALCKVDILKPWAKFGLFCLMLLFWR